jgi:hypothetical protein
VRRLGGLDAATHAREQGDAQLRLEAPDLLGERRLSEHQPLRRGGERSLPKGGEEVLELLQRHVRDLKGKPIARRGNKG